MWTAITDDEASGRRVLEEVLAPMLGRPVEALDGMLLVGTESRVADRVAAYAEAGVEELVLWPVLDEVAQLERFAERIAPGFAAADAGRDPAAGTLGSMPPSRRLDWDALLNARDLGGLPTADGRETRHGALVRSDSLASLTPAGRDAVLAYGVRTVVDLRLPFELKAEPNPFAGRGRHGVAYHNVSFIDPASPPPGIATTLAEDYSSMLDRFGRRVAAVVTTIADAADGGVLIHCAAGKDRTGLIVACCCRPSACRRSASRRTTRSPPRRSGLATSASWPKGRVSARNARRRSATSGRDPR